MADDIYMKVTCPACGGHVKFPSENLGETVACPHCSEKLILSEAAPAKVAESRHSPALRFRWIWLGISIIAAAALIWGFLIAKPPADGRSVGSKPAQSNVPVIRPAENSASSTSHQLFSQNGLVASVVTLQKKDQSKLLYAVGTIRNTSAQQHFGVRVEMDFFDAQGRKIGSASDYNPVLEVSEQWNFKALVTDPKAVRVVITAIKEN